uniref:Tr-type G domain-containing protein n=1 Tax=Lotharella globosa TaxID=91324 RepID=A0A7S4DTN1_9EUKA
MRAMLNEYEDEAHDDPVDYDEEDEGEYQATGYEYTRYEPGTEIQVQAKPLPGPLAPPSPSLTSSESVGQGLSKLQNVPSVGSSVVARYTADGGWYPATVTCITPLGDGHNLYRVMYEGYGNEEELTMEHVRLPSKKTAAPRKQPTEKKSSKTSGGGLLAPQGVTKSRSVPGKLGDKKGKRNNNTNANAKNTRQPKKKEDTKKIRIEFNSKKQNEKRKSLVKLQSNDTKDLPKINLVVVGHVDAGKSTLMGHLMVKIGKIDQRTIRKFQKESAIMGKGSFAYAWVLDGHQEERERGITVDVAVTHFATAKRRVTLLDAPGHRDFVPNMISGASQADAAILVVPAKIGEFENGFDRGGQTKEHATLIRSLGVRNVIIAVNKLDTVGWDKKRFEEVSNHTTAYLHSLGYKPTQLQTVPVSGLKGENLTDRKDVGLTHWYKGPTLTEAIDNIAPPKKPADAALIMIVSDVYKASQGSTGGLTLAGKIESGAMIAKDKIIVHPQQKVITVKAICTQGKPVTVAKAGDSVEVSVKDATDDEVSIGCIIGHPSKPLPYVTEFKVKVLTLNYKIPLLAGQNVIVYSLGMGHPAYIHSLESQIDRRSGELIRSKPRCVQRNSAAEIMVRTHQPICLDSYASNPVLGRVSIRRGDETVAYGVVASTVPLKSKK